ncbi:MAG: putative membrane protein [Natronomonas sp.]
MPSILGVDRAGCSAREREIPSQWISRINGPNLLGATPTPTGAVGPGKVEQMSTSDHQTEYSNGTNPPAGTGTSIRSGVIGGIVAVAVPLLPLSSVLGGAVAGYLERKADRSGTTAGIVSGVVAGLPYLLGGLYLSFGDRAIPGPELGVPSALLVAAAAGFTIVYTVGLSVLGSFAGSCVYDRRAT